jgi:DNA-directed RNA polymerase specialized sigma24 family protein
METLKKANQIAADFHWLATLLTGRREIAVDAVMEAIAVARDPNDFFTTWMQSWSRRLLIAKSLTTVRADLAASARRMALRRSETSALPPRNWVLDRGTTKSDLKWALLSIDVFPRAAVLLLVFERVPLEDAAILLDAEPELVRKAHAAGLRKLTISLARMQSRQSAAARPDTVTSGRQYA